LSGCGCIAGEGAERYNNGSEIILHCAVENYDFSYRENRRKAVVIRCEEVLEHLHGFLGNCDNF
jgi:hypothetical protein